MRELIWASLGTFLLISPAFAEPLKNLASGDIPANLISISPSGDRLVSVGSDEIFIHERIFRGASAVTFFEDQTQALIAEGGKLHFYDFASAKIFDSIPIPGIDRISLMATMGSQIAVTGPPNNEISLWYPDVSKKEVF